jgi:hypothetical protein
VRRMALLVALAAFAAGCRSWKKEPDTYRIDCNVPYAKVFVYDDDGKLLCTQMAGESFEKYDEDGHVEVKADGYYTYSGPAEQLRIIAQKSWYCELKKRRPGDEEPTK